MTTEAIYTPIYGKQRLQAVPSPMTFVLGGGGLMGFSGGGELDTALDFHWGWYARIRPESVVGLLPGAGLSRISLITRCPTSMLMRNKEG